MIRWVTKNRKEYYELGQTVIKPFKMKDLKKIVSFEQEKRRKEKRRQEKGRNRIRCDGKKLD